MLNPSSIFISGVHSHKQGHPSLSEGNQRHYRVCDSHQQHPLQVCGCRRPKVTAEEVVPVL